MSQKPAPTEVALTLRQELDATGRASRRMRSRTFWGAFGIARRTSAALRRVQAALADNGLAARTSDGALGTEDADAWITLTAIDRAAERPDASVPAKPATIPHPLWPSSLTRTTDRAPIRAQPQSSVVASTDAAVDADAAPRVTSRVSRRPWAPSPPSDLPPRAKRDIWLAARSFTRRHPIASLVIALMLIVLVQRVGIGSVVVPFLLWWLALRRWPELPTLVDAVQGLDGLLTWMREPRNAGMAFTGVVVAGLAALGALANGRPEPRATTPSAAIAPTGAQPAETSVAPRATSEEAIGGFAAAAQPPLDPTATSAPTDRPTETPLPPTNVPDTATPAPPIDVEPSLDARCDDFPSYETMKAWRDYWQARGVANPGRLDGDGDGLACEWGEGGRPAATRPPTVPPPPPAPAIQPLYQAPAPPPPPPPAPVRTCCKYCDPSRSKPCGDSCISLDKNCHKGVGCACSG